MFELKIVSNFLLISFNICFVCHHLIEMVLLSAQHMFWLRNKKKVFNYTLLSRGLYRGSYTSAHVLLDLSNKMRKRG